MQDLCRQVTELIITLTPSMVIISAFMSGPSCRVAETTIPQENDLED